MKCFSFFFLVLNHTTQIDEAARESVIHSESPNGWMLLQLTELLSDGEQSDVYQIKCAQTDLPCIDIYFHVCSHSTNEQEKKYSHHSSFMCEVFESFRPHSLIQLWKK